MAVILRVRRIQDMARGASVRRSMRGSDEDIVAVTNAVIAEYNTLAKR